MKKYLFLCIFMLAITIYSANAALGDYFHRRVAIEPEHGDVSTHITNTFHATDYDGLTNYDIDQHEFLLTNHNASIGASVNLLPDYDILHAGYPPVIRGVPYFQVRLAILPVGKLEAYVELEQIKSVSHVVSNHNLRVTFSVPKSKIIVQEFLNGVLKKSWDYPYKVLVGEPYRITLTPAYMEIYTGTSNVISPIDGSFTKRGVIFETMSMPNYKLGAWGRARFYGERFFQTPWLLVPQQPSN